VKNQSRSPRLSWRGAGWRGAGSLVMAVLSAAVMGAGCNAGGSVIDVPEADVAGDVTPPEIEDLLSGMPLNDEAVTVTIRDPRGSNGASPSGVTRPGISAIGDDGVQLDVELSGTDRWTARGVSMADGPHTILWSATDQAGNTSTAMESIVIDRTSPVVTVTQMPSSVETSDQSIVDLTYVFTVEDPHFDRVTVSVYDCTGYWWLFDHIAWPEGSGPGEVDDQSQTFTAPGTHTVTFRFHNPNSADLEETYSYCFEGIAQDAAVSESRQPRPNSAYFLGPIEVGHQVDFTWRTPLGGD
jgi:hypothetical protein